MINLFENLDVESTDFLRSQLFANLKIPSVVINDDGFLPIEVDSPFKFYCGFGDENTPLYFNRLKVPEFHRIVATASKGEVYDLYEKRAEISENIKWSSCAIQPHRIRSLRSVYGNSYFQTASHTRPDAENIPTYADYSADKDFSQAEETV